MQRSFVALRRVALSLGLTLVSLLPNETQTEIETETDLYHLLCFCVLHSADDVIAPSPSSRYLVVDVASKSAHSEFNLLLIAIRMQLINSQLILFIVLSPRRTFR